MRESKRVDLLATFRSHQTLNPDPACSLRIQATPGIEAEHAARELSSVTGPGLDLKRNTSQGAVCFELIGSYTALLRFVEGETTSSKPGGVRHAAAEAIRNWKRREFELELPRDRCWRLGEGASILGILNTTPDSFSDGAQFLEVDAAIAHGLKMLEDGADAIDVGGESTRPGSASVHQDDEISRVAPVIAGLRRLTDCPISIDTSKAEVARVALEEGADIINDVTGLTGDEGMAALAAHRRVPVVIMHMRGTPQTMQDDPRYDDPVGEILRWLRDRRRAVEAEGIDPGRTILDPGIGFGKRSKDNLALIRDVNEFRSLGSPVLIGLSRKSFLGKLLGRSVEDREAGTLVANSFCALGGVSIIRTHHIPNAREMSKVLAALRPS